MEFELWMLLVFPLFFAMGWLTARMDIKELLTESSLLPRSYFQGLNFLLNEQQDKAIEAFIEVVKVDPQTIELHFALGSLFRRRGEVDRALRMHLNLVERADLDEDKKQQALFELAQDYLKAGILDRAEEALQQLLSSRYAKEALDFLLEIYQKEKDWLKAIDICRRLTDLTGQSYSKEAAAFYCELATSELTRKQTDAAKVHLEQALEVHPHAVRATIMLGDIEVAAGNHKHAIEIWKRVEEQDAQYLPLVAERLMQAHQQSDHEAEGIQLLQSYQEKYPSQDLMDVLFKAVLKRDGASAANELVRKALQRNPTLLGLDKFLEARLLEVTDKNRADVEMVKNLVHQRTRSLAMYYCSSCGFKARQFYWHCPACHGWETYSPKRSEENGGRI
ncbi:MAG: lipopolysaccharide assembly protein LapB [Gallionellales bacterium 35-53-114]|jgi:lipopolysaccharide biosynthesis regulator YciM|nr:MAG: lipopolysaccharide assembly protein LapB [Gallionellales bacterium 35-53-114]OYZ65331.1 MAG: lipopolysaccharide assembly protein LapB [Gallionellales bacterium 24-53-125]OZB08238.1 MAG: lipopolysaccharide assembly protein LapB [Gallionellales bacterium 39-52-133]HQS58168.1 lipopolysaccharide assembly protein LapB [Gallionellaceae bacterium]HQS73723.1 lipopolysaccharide assembly protein LapB [Gallionellaceae bacterium]